MDINMMGKMMSERPYSGRKVEHIWAVVAIDKDGTEALPAIMKKGIVLPTICTDPKNLPGLRKLALGMIESDPTLRLVLRRYDNAIDIEELHDGKETDDN